MILILLVQLPLPISALEGDWGLSALEAATPSSAEAYLGENRPGGDWKALVNTFLARSREQLRDTALNELRFCVLLFLITLLTSLGELADFSGRAKQCLRLASVLAVASASVTELDSFTAEALEALEQLTDYSRALLPVLAGTASLSGTVATASAKCAATVLVMDMLLSLGGKLIAPAVCGYTALVLVTAAVGNHALSSAARLMNGVCMTALTLMATLFTLWQGLISTVTGSGEDAGVRLTRTLLSTSLPVVGKLLSDAASSLSAAAGSVRAAAGVFGLVVVLGLCALPFIRMGCRYLAFRLTGCLCRTLTDGALARLMDDLAASFSMLLALLGTASVCMFVSIWSMMRMGL